MTAAMNGVAGQALVAVPWLLLGLAAWRAGRARKRIVAAGRPAARPRTPPLAAVTTLKEGAASVAAATAPAVPAVEAGVVETQEARLVRSLEASEARGDMLQLTRDGLALSRLLLARGAQKEAKALLTKTVMVATRTKLGAEHAAARIELADVARIEGDMTTACEHWQLAKQLFHELDRRADAQRMGDNLRLNRCPTDWFLTGF